MLTDTSTTPLSLAAQVPILAPRHHAPPLDLQHLLEMHAFRDLFIEVLGWDRASNRHLVQVDGHEFLLNAVAQKRGFQVFHASVDRYTIINRHRLRAIQKRLAAGAHEHILIYSSDQPHRQVWQWGFRGSDGRKHRHLEHPFLSHSPPPQLLSRLQQLRIAFADEEALTLVDAIERVQAVLNQTPEFNLFATRPRYVQQSDVLWQAMYAGGVKEFQAFVGFHCGLIQYFATKWHRKFLLEEDDAVQLCALGVMRAARLFDPRRGCLFSTYVGKTVKHRVRRMVADVRLPIHFPQYVLPHCFAMLRLLQQETVAAGPTLARAALERELAGATRPFVDAWQAFRATIERETLSERGSSAAKAVRRLPEPQADPSFPTLRNELIEEIRAGIDTLSERDRQVVRLYYGFDGEPLTLQDIGDRLGLTRERVRQILNENYARLRNNLDVAPEDLRALNC